VGVDVGADVDELVVPGGGAGVVVDDEEVVPGGGLGETIGDVVAVPVPVGGGVDVWMVPLLVIDALPVPLLNISTYSLLIPHTSTYLALALPPPPPVTGALELPIVELAVSVVVTQVGAFITSRLVHPSTSNTVLLLKQVAITIGDSTTV
jgi:hypothetical protein